MIWRRRLEPAIRPLMRLGFQLRRSMTLGVRGLVLDKHGRVLLVEHTYVHGWHLPGGGVERGEHCEDALRRELAEEAGVRPLGPVRLVQVENDEAHFRGDHVLLYRIDCWEACASDAAGEILRVEWFDPAQPPAGTTPHTIARIAAGLAAGSG
jgi:ADP-ribose pyrophosphatase YjhB (NUDIX family)